MQENKKKIVKNICSFFYLSLVIAALVFTDSISFPQLGGMEKKEGVVVRLSRKDSGSFSIEQNNRSSTPKRSPVTRKIDINSATREELESLSGIGPVYAERIIKERPFCKLDDLLNISGIGEKTLERVKEGGVVFVKAPLGCDNNDSLTAQEKEENNSQVEEDTKKKISQEEDCSDGSIDINSATREELESLSGIGPVYAERIIKKRPFKNLNDLLSVNGIGEVRLEGIKNQGCAFISL